MGPREEAAAAVAFFNGDVDDDRPIGRDRNGRDWETVGHWAQLRAQNGHPNPVGIQYWEVGNEIFGAVRGARGSCASWGWENVWTCDGTDYVQGDEAHDGFLDFRDAMRSVDSTIEVGAVGVGARGEWSDWDDKVMDGAGSDIDFYVVHHYGANTDLKASKLLGLPSRQWPDITDEVESGYADHGIDPATPIAITEHNLIATQDGDNQQFMAKALNAFYLADTIGQMATNGVTMANQWNLANGRAPNGTDYGLVDAQTLQRSPAYYALALWSRVGDELLQVDTDGLDRVQVFGARDANGELQLMVINSSGSVIDATVSVDAQHSARSATADVVQAASLESTSVTWNGSATPSEDLSERGQALPLNAAGELEHDFPAYSITLVTWHGG